MKLDKLKPEEISVVDHRNEKQLPKGFGTPISNPGSESKPMRRDAKTPGLGDKPIGPKKKDV